MMFIIYLVVNLYNMWKCFSLLWLLLVFMYKILKLKIGKYLDFNFV